MIFKNAFKNKEALNKLHEIDKTTARDVNVLVAFIQFYCLRKHGAENKIPVRASGAIGMYLNDSNCYVCDECRKLLLYSVSKRIVCPYVPKPSCKKCETHCYNETYRIRIKNVMRFSGMQLIKKGNIRLIKKYFF